MIHSLNAIEPELLRQSILSMTTTSHEQLRKRVVVAALHSFSDRLPSGPGDRYTNADVHEKHVDSTDENNIENV